MGLFVFLLICSIIGLAYILYVVLKSKKELEKNYNAIYEKYTPIIDLDKTCLERQKEINKAEDKIEELREDYKQKHAIYNELLDKIAIYEEDLEMADIGLYKPVYEYDTSEKYKTELSKNRELQKSEIKNGKAVYCTTTWTVSGSKTKGKQDTNKLIKLVLKAFNGQCDSFIKNVSWNNVNKMEERIIKTFDDINKLCVIRDIHIGKNYLKLKQEELKLAYEYDLKKYEEKEEQKRIKEQIREEEKLQKELEKKQKEIEEQQKREEEIKRLQQEAFEQGKEEEAKKYQEEIDKLNEQIENSKRAVSQAQLTKTGNVYVISNIGSFGENIYKIGMTRRLDPQERIDELGNASVPFSFDVHAMIHSDNAPELEKQLHELFKNKSVNRINYRKEFFNVSLSEIEKAVNEFTNSEIEFTKIAEAREYRETQAIINAENHIEVKHDKEELPLEI